MSQAKVMQPFVVTDAMLVSSNLYETAPAAYAVGTTYALGAYAAVSGLLGEMLIYKSLQAGNIGNTPASSPTWWVYSSSTYGNYIGINFGVYNIGYRVVDPQTHNIYENLVANNSTHPLDPSTNPTWSAIGESTLSLPPQWLIGTTYALGELTSLTFSGVDSNGVPDITYLKVYKSLQASNIGHFPGSLGIYWQELLSYPVPYYYNCNYDFGQVVKDSSNRIYLNLQSTARGVPLNNSTGWLKVGPANRTAMFDKQTSTTSTANKEITFTIASGIIDTIGFVGLDADLAVITVRDGLAGAVVFTKTIGLTGGNPTDAWSYYFSEPMLRRTQLVIDGIPPYVNSHVTVTLTGGGAIGVGNVIIGKNKDIGLAEFGLTAGIIDFSTKTTDAFGATTFVKRGYKKKVNVRTFVDNSKLNLLQNLLYSLRAEPCLWQFAPDNPEVSEATMLYGFYKDFSTDIAYPTQSYVNIEIEGLI
jgi:hypothetical protein